MNAKGVCIKRPPPANSAYKMSIHNKSVTNPIRENLLFTSVKRMRKDGLRNVVKLTTVVDRVPYGVYTKLLINVGKRTLWSQVFVYLFYFIFQTTPTNFAIFSFILDI